MFLACLFAYGFFATFRFIFFGIFVAGLVGGCFFAVCFHSSVVFLIFLQSGWFSSMVRSLRSELQMQFKFWENFNVLLFFYRVILLFFNVL